MQSPLAPQVSFQQCGMRWQWHSRYIATSTFGDISSLIDVHLDRSYSVKVQRCSLTQTPDCLGDVAYRYESKTGSEELVMEGIYRLLN